MVCYRLYNRKAIWGHEEVDKSGDPGPRKFAVLRGEPEGEIRSVLQDIRRELRRPEYSSRHKRY